VDGGLQATLAPRHQHRLDLGGEAGDDDVEPSLPTLLGEHDRRVERDDEGEERRRQAAVFTRLLAHRLVADRGDQRPGRVGRRGDEAVARRGHLPIVALREWRGDS
jgi:hypothetical protein